MRFSRLPAFALLALCIPASAADCFLCDDVIELNDQRATCFETIYGTVKQAFAETGSTFLKINFGSCEGLKAEDERGGVGTLRDPGATPTKFIYQLDEDRVNCLKAYLEAQQATLSPATRIDLYKVCPK